MAGGEDVAEGDACGGADFIGAADELGELIIREFAKVDAGAGGGLGHFEMSFLEQLRIDGVDFVGGRVDFAGELDGPGDGGYASVEFAVDEIGEAAEEEAEGNDHAGGVADVDDGGFIAAGEEDEGEDGEEDAAVCGHAAFVDAEDAPVGEGVGETPEERGDVIFEALGKIVEEAEAEAAADEDAPDADGEGEVGDFFDGEAEHAVASEFAHEEVATDEAEEVGEAIPAGLDEEEFEDDGIEIVEVVGEWGKHEEDPLNESED